MLCGVGAVEEANWVDKLKPFIRQRIETYQKSEQRFNLLAVVEDRKVALEKQKAQLLVQLASAQDRTTESAMEIGMDLTIFCCLS